MNTTQPITSGAHHIGLTVLSLHTSVKFFENALGFELLGEMPDYPAAFLSDGSIMITLWQAANPMSATAFDRKNVVGLHHLALSIDGHERLDDLYQALSKYPGVTIEFAPEYLGEGPTRHFIVSIPGGIRVEFISPVQQAA